MKKATMGIVLALLLLTRSALPAVKPGGLPSSSSFAQPALPDAVRALLPADARIVEGFLADLTDDGERDWAVMYTTPRAGSAFAVDARVTVLIATAGGWQIALDIVEEFANGGEVARARIGGREMLQVTFFVGAHAASLALYLWDSDAGNFAEVLREGSNSPGFDVLDSGVITWFSAYCGSYAVSPALYRAHWWDGAGFVRDDGRDAALLARTWEEVEAALSGPAGEAAEGRACLYDALAYLARAAGDEEDVTRRCTSARAEVPDDAWPWLVCGRPG